jgi:membrane associated rhomboid family serine protease
MLPVGDFLRRRTTPYVNWTLIAINVAVFVYTLTLSTNVDGFLAGLPVSEADRFYFDWGFAAPCVADNLGLGTDVPRRVLDQVCPAGDRELLQVFTSMFLHGGFAHILSNMLFLWIFGDNVEDRLGHVRYLAFYLLCGVAAAATQVYMAANAAPVPTVGASGAIAGVLGAYLVLYPTARVQVVILPLFFIPFFVPAVVLIGFWFLTQLFAGIAEIGNTTAGAGIAWWAHIGGFVAGAVLVWLFKRSQARPVRVLDF